MKQIPTMSKVFIVFLLANWNLSLLVSAVTVLPLSSGVSVLFTADLVSIRSVLILLVNTQAILP